jgi:hypothetical protein
MRGKGMEGPPGLEIAEKEVGEEGQVGTGRAPWGHSGRSLPVVTPSLGCLPHVPCLSVPITFPMIRPWSDSSRPFPSLACPIG